MVVVVVVLKDKGSVLRVPRFWIKVEQLSRNGVFEVNVTKRRVNC